MKPQTFTLLNLILKARLKNETTTVILTRGSLQRSLSSIDLNFVDVTPLAKVWDNKLTKLPTKTDEKKCWLGGRYL